LQQALLDMRDIRIGLAFLTSTGFTKKKGDPYSDCVIHSKYFDGYEIVGTEANSEKKEVWRLPHMPLARLVPSNQAITWKMSADTATTA